ncbi:hypothetical protein EJB05_05617, partial [Eragrostis curvula]
MLRSINYNIDKEIEAPVEHKSVWNSDDESIPHSQDSGQNHQDHGCLDILAFHPYKEIVSFLHRTLWGLIAYHLNTAKLEDLGSLSPDNKEIDDIGMSFPYTPCTIRDFPERLSFLDNKYQVIKPPSRGSSESPQFHLRCLWGTNLSGTLTMKVFRTAKIADKTVRIMDTYIDILAFHPYKNLRN